MSAITVRQVPDSVHAWLRHEAKTRHMSVENLCRLLFADAMTPDAPATPGPRSFAEAASAYTAPAKSAVPHRLTDLWGALKDSVHMPYGEPGLAPLLESWKAEG
jgi:plasmid stability protein